MERSVAWIVLLMLVIGVFLGVMRFVLNVDSDLLYIFDISITTGVFLAIYVQTMSLVQQTNLALRQHYKPLAQEMYCKLEEIENKLIIAEKSLEQGLYDKLKVATILPADLTRLRLLPGISKDLVEELEQLAREYIKLLAKTRKKPTKTSRKKLAETIEKLTANLQVAKDHIKNTYAFKREELDCPAAKLKIA